MEDKYGIDKEHAHPRARELAPEEFFWDCSDELAPFGSDEGDTAFAEYREWRQENPEAPLVECLSWTIESVGEIEFSEYSSAILSPTTVANQVSDPAFNDQQYVYTVDVSVIATGFGQLVDLGRIDPDAKPPISLALERQILWSQAQPDWTHAGEYINNLKVLQRILQSA